MTLNDLVDKVISEIKKDILNEDVTALEELLLGVPEDMLKAFLPESEESIAD